MDNLVLGLYMFGGVVGGGFAFIYWFMFVYAESEE